jgi:hypothetical protein
MELTFTKSGAWPSPLVDWMRKVSGAISIGERWMLGAVGWEPLRRPCFGVS